MDEDHYLPSEFFRPIIENGIRGNYDDGSEFSYFSHVRYEGDCLNCLFVGAGVENRGRGRGERRGGAKKG